MPTVRVRDIVLNYIEAGTGRDAVVLIMGFGGDHLAWSLQMPAFAERYRVIAFDNRGVGQSSAPDVPYTTALMADDTAGLLDALGIQTAHVVGVSMGGMIAQELSLRHPSRVRTVALHATCARPDRYVLALLDAIRAIRLGLGHAASLRAMALWLFEPASYNTRPEFVELFLQNALANPYPQPDVGFARQAEAVRAHDTLARLGQIRMPTLITVAANDILVPSHFSRELAAAIPGAELHVLPHGGHGYFWEFADEFNALGLDFLAKHR